MKHKFLSVNNILLFKGSIIEIITRKRWFRTRTTWIAADRRKTTVVASIVKIITVITTALKNHITFLFQPTKQCCKRDDKNQMKTESKTTSQGKYQDAYN